MTLSRLRTLIFAAACWPATVGASANHVVFSNEILLDKGELTKRATSVFERAVAPAPKNAAFTVIVCLGHPQAPHGEAIGALAGRLVEIIEGVRPEAKVGRVARPDNETTCPAGISVDWRYSVAMVWAGAVLWSDGDVQVLRSDGKREPVARGVTLASGDAIETGEGGQCRLQTPGGAVVGLRSVARVSFPTGESVTERLTLNQGRIWVRVRAGGDAATPLTVEAAGALATAHVATFQLTVEEGGRVRVETRRGSVLFGVGETQVTVAAGFGAIAMDGKLDGPHERPAAPTNLRPVGGDHLAGAALSWNEVPDATVYRVQVSADVQFLRLVHEAEVAKTVHEMPTLAPGPYFWRVAAVDARGLTGKASQLFAIAIGDGAVER